MKIPLCIPCLDKNELEAIKKVLKSGWLTGGPKNEELEKKFAKYIGTKKAITVNSCASALFVAVKSLGITGEIIVPSFTFPATVNAVITAGAKPVFADINSETFNIDPKSIEEKITKRTKAIIIVHTAGQPCEMDKILTIAKKHKLFLIEDSAQTIGGTFRNKRVGSFGDIGCFSFFPTKNMTTGEGGMITTNNSRLATKIKTLIAHGIVGKPNKKGIIERLIFVPGYNFRMSNVLAAIGVEQLKKLGKMNRKRISLAKYLNDKIVNPKIEKPVIIKDARSVYQMYIIKVKKERDEIIKKLKKAGIAATIYSSPPVHLQPYYKAYRKNKKQKLPNTIKAARKNIVLPMFPGLKKKQIDYIIKVLNKI